MPDTEPVYVLKEEYAAELYEHLLIAIRRLRDEDGRHARAPFPTCEPENLPELVKDALVLFSGLNIRIER